MRKHRCAWPQPPIWSRFCRPILEQFRHATGIHAEATYQASAMFTTQIHNGAPFDLFLSADLGYPKRLIDASLADAAGTRDSSAPDRLRQGNPGTVDPEGIASASFARPAARSASQALCNRQSRARALWPCRRGSAHQPQALRELKPRLATAENIAQAAQFVDSAMPTRDSSRSPPRATPHMASERALFRHSAQPLPAYRTGRGNRQQHPATSGAHTSCSTSFFPPPFRRSLPKAALHPFTKDAGYPTFTASLFVG